jgi:16S rRNA (guanine527-N7)-methyltransferase
MIEQTQTFADWLDIVFARAGQTATPQIRSRLLIFVQMLREWNEQINLTRITDDEGIAVRHILDSLTLLPHLESVRLPITNGHPLRLIDIGSGAGLPGLVLKIIHPEWELVMLDALAKRLRFLDAVIQTLALTGAATWHGRAEDGARQPELREQFDVVTARAVAPLAVLAELCLPFVRVGGIFLAMKGDPDGEWPAAARSVKLLGGELERLDTFCLPGTEMRRAILCFRKLKTTPPSYPRQAGRPEKQPL